MKYFYLITLFFFLFACVDLKKSSQIETIQRISKSLDSMQIVLHQHPIDIVKEQEQIYFKLEQKIRKNVDVSDTINLDFGKKLDEIKFMREKFQPLEIVYKQLGKDIKNEAKILKNLKLDISKSNGERGEYQKNLDFELEKFSKLKVQLEDYTNTRKDIITIFNQNKQEFENFVNSLENN